MLSKNQRIEFLKKFLIRRGLPNYIDSVNEVVNEIYGNYRKYDFVSIRIKKNENGYFYSRIRTNNYIDIKHEWDGRTFEGIEFTFNKLTLEGFKIIRNN